MDNRYKITLSNDHIYKEIELAPDAHRIKVGTQVDCDVRLRKDMFFDQIELTFVKTGTDWAVHCSDSLYLTVGDIRKLVTKKLAHGDSLQVKYQESDHFVFTLDFVIDFDDGKKKYERVINLAGRSAVTIGCANSNNIVLGSSYVKNDEVCLRKDKTGYVLDVKSTTYGAYINGKKAKTGDVLHNGDFLSLSDYFFYLKDECLWTEIRSDLSVKGLNFADKPFNPSYPKFKRNTRVKTVISDEKIEVLDPPAKPQKQRTNIFLQLLPSLGMMLTAGLMASMGSSMIWFSLISGGIAILTAVLTLIDNNKEHKKSLLQRTETYNAYISNKRIEIEGIREHEKGLLEQQFVSQDCEYQWFEDFSSQLFDRTLSDEDFLAVRLGSGAVMAKRTVEYKKQERLEADDELQMMPKQICSEYSHINDAPVVCDLKSVNAVGIFGAEQHRFDIMKNIVMDIAARQFYSDVKMIFVASEENKDKIYWLRFLPHAFLDGIGVRGIVCNDGSKNVIFEYLYKEMTVREQNKAFENRIVVFFYDEYGFNNHPISKFVDKASELGITLVFFGDTKADIPVGCGYLIDLVSSTQGKLIDANDESLSREFVYPHISNTQAERIVEILAPVYTEEISLEGTLTKNISMFELLNIIAVDDLNLRDRWAKSQVFKSMAAPVGVSKTGVVYLDLHDKAHGPHGLVAGTTGSGKSEILQTYILSMASLFSPDEVGFLIIDFKGGGMVNQFKELPHLLGAITNIDGKEINRSLKSIKAELQKRQRMFAEADVNHIDKYIRKYRSNEVAEPLPHLIIIVDEFAELKAEQPEFMKELISAARIGRSLGVHLILATQKPSGQVDDQIWSNSRFKLCLKVQTQDDSNEVLKSPLAAEIKEPGRAYLQVGNNEIFELFQSAYSGAPENQAENTTREFAIFALNPNGKRMPVFVQKNKKSDAKAASQLDAMVRYIASYCEGANVQHLPNICLPPLPERVAYSNDMLPQSVAVGLFDDPDCQKQEAAYLDIANKNTIIIGSPQYGKTNLLQSMIRTIAENNTPDEANIYIIDFASMTLKNFEEMNHVGGVVTSSDDEKLKNLFKLLHTEIAARKEKLLSVGVSSFAAYKDAGYKDMPQIYLVVDNLTALIELYLQDDDTLLVLVREGLAVGIATIVANPQTAGIGYRYFSNFSNRIALYCNDTNEYANLFDHVDLQPSDLPGRCVLSIDKKLLECQTYLAFDGEREIDRVKEVHAFVDRINSNNPGKVARKIPAIPAVLKATDMQAMFDTEQHGYDIPIGVTYANVEAFGIDLSQIGVFGVCGAAPKYQHGMIRYLLQSMASVANEYPVEVHIFDDVKRKFAAFKDLSIVNNYTLDTDAVLTVISDWHKRLEDRYQAMLDNPDARGDNSLLVMVIQNNDVAKRINDDFDAMNLYTEITTRYKSLGVCIIFANYENTSVSYDAPEPLRQVKQEQHLFFYGDLDTLKPFDAPYEAIRENRKKLGNGDAYYIRGNDVIKLKMIEATE